MSFLILNREMHFCVRWNANVYIIVDGMAIVISISVMCAELVDGMVHAMPRLWQVK